MHHAEWLGGSHAVTPRGVCTEREARCREWRGTRCNPASAITGVVHVPVPMAPHAVYSAPVPFLYETFTSFAKTGWSSRAL